MNDENDNMEQSGRAHLPNLTIVSSSYLLNPTAHSMKNLDSRILELNIAWT